MLLGFRGFVVTCGDAGGGLGQDGGGGCPVPKQGKGIGERRVFMTFICFTITSRTVMQCVGMVGMVTL